MTSERYVNGPVELRLGRWQDVLRGEVCDVLCGDPPYSARTHEGQRSGSELVATINYEPMTIEGAFELAESWAPRVRDWAILFCDHEAFSWHEAAWRDEGWHVFAPVYWVKPDAVPRKVGDGPTCSVEQIMIARPNGWPRVRGSRRWHYTHSVAELRGCGHAGAKPLALIAEILADYAAPGARVIDPFAGTATTLRAATRAGLACLGAEKSPDAYARAVDRLAGMGPSLTGTGQQNLFVKAG